jgi:hypothetical protein
MAAAALTVIAKGGVRVLSDYLPPKISPSGEYQAVFELESQLGKRPKFAAIARYLQFLAHSASPAMKDAT